MIRSLDAATIRLHPDDEVVIARTALEAGTRLRRDDGEVVVSQAVPAGHKVALRAIAAGAPVHRYGQVIGFATQPIRPGEHVHTHNLGAGPFPRPADTDFPSPVVPLPG